MTFTVPRRALLVIAFVVAISAGIGIGVLIAAGGGDTKTTTIVKTDAVEASGAAGGESGEEESVRTEEGNSSCAAQGIDSTVGNEGTCTEEGTKYVVVDKGHTLKLKELDAKLLGIKRTQSVTGEYGESKTASGTYVIFELEITNRTHAPLYFDSSQEQVSLFLADNTYSENFEVENYVLEDSFLNQFEEIQPDGSQIGTIAFDVPNSVLWDLDKTGNLDVVNFSDEGTESTAPEIGVIRTYE